MEFDELKELMSMLKETDITELQIEKEGVKVKIKREKFFGHLEMAHSAPVEKRETKETKPEEVDTEGRLITITSPIVGTFYRSPLSRGRTLCRYRHTGEEGAGTLPYRSHEADE